MIRAIKLILVTTVLATAGVYVAGMFLGHEPEPFLDVFGWLLVPVTILWLVCYARDAGKSWARSLRDDR